jgi:hypothetical protein
MGGFLEAEKNRLEEFKSNSGFFTQNAKKAGVYKNKERFFCIPLENSEENLFIEIRNKALNYFSENGIKWHDGQGRKPSNHLCDSQVCCVNFLFPFHDKPELLKKVLIPVFPNIRKMLPVEKGYYLSFEWIGQENYLKEKVRLNAQRTRGAHFTSADAVVTFEREDNLKQVVLIEWKYTESYGGFNLKYSKNGTDRTLIYRHLFEQPDCPVQKEKLPEYDSLFFEPFYQFMRQQFLAHEMEKANELSADIVSVLHIAPEHNVDFRKITSPKLVNLGNTAIDIWKNLQINTDRFISVSTEQLFGSLRVGQFPELKNWIEYIHSRYPWISEK